MAEATEDVEQLMSDYAEVWNEGDYSKISDLVSESITVYDPGYTEVVEGRDAFEAYLQELREAFPDFQVTIDEMLASDDIVMTEWTVTATHEGEFNEIPPTENEMELTGMDKILIANGKVQEHRIYHDLQEMFQQLGLAEE